MNSDGLTPMNPSPQFTRSVAANVAYWRQRTQDLNEETLPALDRDRQNLYRATEFGLSLAETWRETTELVLQCFDLIVRRGYWREWIPLLERIRDNYCKGEMDLYGRTLDHLGVFYRFNHQFNDSMVTHKKEFEIGQQLNDPWRLAHASLNLGAAYFSLYMYEEAEYFTRKAESYFYTFEAPRDKFAFVCRDLARIYKAKGVWKTAEENYCKAIKLWREIENIPELLNDLNNLGELLINIGQYEAAQEALSEAQLLLESVKDDWIHFRVLTNLGILNFKKKDYEIAESFFSRAYSNYVKQSGDLYSQAKALHNLGIVNMERGKVKEATRFLEMSVRNWKQINEPVELANSLGTLAENFTKQGEDQKAKLLFDQAILLLKAHQTDVWAQKLKIEFEQKAGLLKH